MRTIKFRGKDKLGEWHFGYYYPDFQDTSRAFILSEKDGIVYEAIPETVGQFTGLVDKEGNEIYEGDLVEIYRSRYSVEWDNKYSLFSIHRPIGRIASYPFTDHDRAKVIGTIHDNPELL